MAVNEREGTMYVTFDRDPGTVTTYGVQTAS
jgi:hypothetical protein